MKMADAKQKRNEQLKRWIGSETDLEPPVVKRQKTKVKFDDGAVFLAACSSGDTDEVLKLLHRGADINYANVDGLTALHQVCAPGAGPRPPGLRRPPPRPAEAAGGGRLPAAGRGGGFPRRRRACARGPFRPAGGGVGEPGCFRGRGERDGGPLGPRPAGDAPWALGPSRGGCARLGPDVSGRLGRPGPPRQTTNGGIRGPGMGGRLWLVGGHGMYGF